MNGPAPAKEESMDSLYGLVAFALIATIYLVGFAVLALLYFIPSIVACLMHSDKLAVVIAVNLCAGWTLLGWVASLAIAVWPAPRPVFIPYPYPPSPPITPSTAVAAHPWVESPE